MKCALFFKISNQMLDNQRFVELFAKKEVNRLASKLIKQSQTIKNITICFNGANGDDFIKNKTTVIVNYDRFKISRIVKRLKLK